MALPGVRFVLRANELLQRTRRKKFSVHKGPSREHCRQVLPSADGVGDKRAGLRALPIMPAGRSGSRSRAFVKVQEGCRHRCAFCIVPRARGRSRSQDPGVVLDQVRLMVESGHVEITLTGVDLGSYGQDLAAPTTLATLLAEMVRMVAKHGMQFTAHAQGDAAGATLLEAYEQVDREVPLRHLRMGITHSSFMTRETVEKAARLGVVLDIQPIWLYLDTRTLVGQFGYDRLRYFQPLKTIFEVGGVAAVQGRHRSGHGRAAGP